MSAHSPEGVSAQQAAPQWRRALSLLRERRYGDGWPLYEARKLLAQIDTPTPMTPAPEWRGEPLAGKRIVVCAEQGYGDQIMFGRWLSQLRSLAGEVVIACDPRALGRLFEAEGFWTRPLFVDKPIPDCDYWTLFGSLPLCLRQPFPPPPKYIDLELRGGGGVGVKTRGGPRHRNDANRSLPEAEALQLLQLGRDLSPGAGGGFDFLETAEIMAGLDLVITVDTAVAHAAGAIGAPCWVLLPYVGLDWRWNDGVRSDWYPDFRLFRQQRPGDWATVLDEVRSGLREM